MIKLFKKILNILIFGIIISIWISMRMLPQKALAAVGSSPFQIVDSTTIKDGGNNEYKFIGWGDALPDYYTGKPLKPASGLASYVHFRIASWDENRHSIVFYDTSGIGDKGIIDTAKQYKAKLVWYKSATIWDSRDITIQPKADSDMTSFDYDNKEGTIKANTGKVFYHQIDNIYKSSDGWSIKIIQYPTSPQEEKGEGKLYDSKNNFVKDIVIVFPSGLYNLTIRGLVTLKESPVEGIIVYFDPDTVHDSVTTDSKGVYKASIYTTVANGKYTPIQIRAYVEEAKKGKILYGSTSFTVTGPKIEGSTNIQLKEKIEPCANICEEKFLYIFPKLECILCRLLNVVVNFFLFLFNFGKSMVERTIYIPSSQLQADHISAPHGVLVNFANSIFVLGFLIIIFANLLRIDLNAYAIKTLLPRLLVAILLVNFSLLITRGVLDLGNVLTKEGLDLPLKIPGAVIYYREKYPESPKDSLSDYKEISKSSGSDETPKIDTTSDEAQKLAGIGGAAITTGLVGMSYMSGLFSLLTLTGVSTAGISWIVFAIFVVIILLFPLIALTLLALLLIVRSLMIWFLAIISPLAFLFMVLPFTRSLYSRWWSELSRWVFMGPLAALLIGLSEAVIGLLTKNAGGLETVYKAVGDPGTGVVNYGNIYWLIPFFGIAMLFAAVAVPFMLGGKIYGAMTSLGRRAGAGFSALTLGRGATLKKLGEKALSERTLEGLGEGKGFGRLISEQRRAELRAEALKKAGERYAMANPGKNIEEIIREANKGERGAQAYLASRGVEFKDAKTLIKNNPAMAGMFKKTRPDLVYTAPDGKPNTKAIREAIDRGEVDIAGINQQGLKELGNTNFKFNELDLNAIEARAPHLVEPLLQHYASKPSEFNNLSAVSQKMVHRMAFARASGDSFKNYIEGIGKNNLEKALTSFTVKELQQIEFSRINNSYKILDANQQQRVYQHLNQPSVLKRTHGQELEPPKTGPGTGYGG